MLTKTELNKYLWNSARLWYLFNKGHFFRFHYIGKSREPHAAFVKLAFARKQFHLKRGRKVTFGVFWCVWKLFAVNCLPIFESRCYSMKNFKCSPSGTILARRDPVTAETDNVNVFFSTAFWLLFENVIARLAVSEIAYLHLSDLLLDFG